ncbi:MAG: hypothetical protein MJA30_02465, partial [Cytophagales bacterium]|nr:hypothetical protein [Cytophagales bacterium]
FKRGTFVVKLAIEQTILYDFFIDRVAWLKKIHLFQALYTKTALDLSLRQEIMRYPPFYHARPYIQVSK